MVRIAFVMLGVVAVFAAPGALAHTTVSVGPYDIEVGWGLEPPVVGVRNTFVLHVTEPSPDNPGVTTGITNAFRDMEATVHYGGASKPLDINVDSRPGHYYSNVIPTRTGSFSISLLGTLNGVPVEVTVPIEDAESTALLDFPPSAGSTSSQDVAALRTAITSMQDELDALRTTSGGESSGAAYDFAVLGLSLAVTAVVLSVLSLVRRPLR